MNERHRVMKEGQRKPTMRKPVDAPPTMRQYLLRHEAGVIGLDEAAAFLVVAPDAPTARKIVRDGTLQDERDARRCGADIVGGPMDEGPDIWMDPAKTSCTQVNRSKPGIVLRASTGA